jgi:GNAT superfamily N-acetyltransferase
MDDELVALTESHGGNAQPGWWDRIRPHSLGWVIARDEGGALIGFVNVAWDGGDHAFLIDTKVRPDHQRRGIATELVRIAARHAKKGRLRVVGGRLRRASRAVLLGLVRLHPDAGGADPPARLVASFVVSDVGSLPLSETSIALEIVRFPGGC